jgi:hypothetical protein
MQSTDRKINPARATCSAVRSGLSPAPGALILADNPGKLYGFDI